MALLNGNANVVVLKDTPDYCIYSLNGNDICLFVVPNQINGNLSLYLDINYKNEYDKLRTNGISQGDVVSKVENDYRLLKGVYSNSLYVLPEVNVLELGSILSGANYDKQQVFTKIIGIASDTKKIQGVLASSGIGLDTNIINVIERNEIDTKFASFLESQQMGHGISASTLQSGVNTNTSTNPFMGTSNNQTVTNPFGGSPTATGQVVNQVSPVNSWDNNQNVPNINNSQSSVGISQQAQPQVQSPTAVEPTPLTEASQQGQFNQINQNPDVPSDSMQNSLNHPKVKTRKLNSKGYVNIVVLMAILVGVTIVSIQLGKFLYSVYG